MELLSISISQTGSLQERLISGLLAHSADAFLQPVSHVWPFPWGGHPLSRLRLVTLILDMFYFMFLAAAGPHALTTCSLPGCVFLFQTNNKSIRKSQGSLKNNKIKYKMLKERSFCRTSEGTWLKDQTWLLLRQVWNNSCDWTYSFLVSDTLSQVTSVSSLASFLTPLICRLPLGVEMPFSFSSLDTKVLNTTFNMHVKIFYFTWV